MALTSSHSLNIGQSKARVHLRAERLLFTVIHEIGLHQHTEAAVADGLLQITTNQTYNRKEHVERALDEAMMYISRYVENQELYLYTAKDTNLESLAS